MIQDLTKGHPTRLILKFALPLLIGNIFQQLYQLSDIVIVGRLLGVNALAAVGAAAPLYFVTLLITLGFTGGLTVVTAQRFGAKDFAGVRRSVTHSIIASTALCLLTTGISIAFLPQILRLMNVPAEIMDDAYTFIFILNLGLIVIVSYNILAGFMRACGDSKTPLYFLIFSSILNIMLNLILIGWFKLGVAGSALGSVIAISLSVLCCIIYISRRFSILKPRRSDWKYDHELMKEHLRIAVPMSFQFSIIALSLMIIQSVCNSFGPLTIAAFTSALRLEQLATQPLIALGLAIATYSAQNFGAGKLGRIRRGVFNSSLISFSVSIFIALSVRFIGEQMIGIFIEGDNPEIVHTAQVYLNISTLFYCFLGQIFIFRNAIQGMGKPGIPFLACVVELLMRSFAAVYLASRIGYLGVCYAGPIAWIGAAVIVAAGYVITIRKLRSAYPDIRKAQSLWQHNAETNLLPEAAPAE